MPCDRRNISEMVHTDSRSSLGFICPASRAIGVVGLPKGSSLKGIGARGYIEFFDYFLLCVLLILIDSECFSHMLMHFFFQNTYFKIYF